MRTPVAFIGYSSSGKTTLLVKLVRRLTDTDERVAVIKHTHHDPNDRKKKGDTELYLEAGAVEVVFAGRHEAVLLRSDAEPVAHTFESAREIPSWLTADRIFVEGFKSLGVWPRILVERVEAELIRPLPDVEAVVTNSSESFDVPVFAHEDLAGLHAFLDRISPK